MLRSHLVPMRPRDPEEQHRAASSLELFFDLVFMVAVSVAAGNLHHELSAGHVADGLVHYAMVFFAIWWAWMNFTWFASAFDNDDWLYRVLTVLQMVGVLVLAAGIEDTFVRGDLHLVTYGYVVMRIAMVAQWLRAAHGSPLRRTALTYAIGIIVAQALWLVRLPLPSSWGVATFVVLALAEISVPYIAERVGETPWHAHHLTERYGLFVLILLGESLLASASAIIDALHADVHTGELVPIAVLALVVTAALWWIYFWAPHHHVVRSWNFVWGYSHYVIFAATGAISVGFGVEIDRVSHHTELGDVAASFTMTVPVAVFLLGVWALAIRPHANRAVNTALPVASLLVLLDPVIPLPTVLTAVVLAVVVGVLVVNDPIEDQAGEVGSEDEALVE